MSWRDLLPATTQEERAAVQAAWEAERARPGERQRVRYRRIDRRQTPQTPDQDGNQRPDIHVRKNHGLPPGGVVNFRIGECPCSECGHEFQWECELASDQPGGCDCCSSTCT